MQDNDVIAMALVILGLGIVAYSPIARALGQRILHGRLQPSDAQPVDEGRMDQISGEVAALRRHLDETQERVDFTERLLAQAREKAALPPGSGR
jgi:hypothetical protein